MFLTNTNSRKGHLYGILSCITDTFLSVILKWIKVLMLELLCLKSEIARVGFLSHYWLLLTTNRRWSQLINNTTSSLLAYLMINGICWILRIIQWMALNHSSVAILRCTGSLRPKTLFTINRVQGAFFNNFHVHWEIVGIYHESCKDGSSTAYLPIAFDNNVRLGDIKLLCQNTIHQLADVWHSHSFCWRMIDVQMHWRILNIWLEMCYDRYSTVYLPIPFGNETVYTIWITWARIWDRACWFMAKPHNVLVYEQTLGAPEHPGFISLWPINHCIFANHSWH